MVPSIVVEIRQYIDSSGRNAFDRWFTGLGEEVQARITVSLDRLERGNISAVKSVSGGVHELRLDFGPGYRIYFGRDGEYLVILLAGGTKRRQQGDIHRAQLLWQQYKDRKRGA